MTTICIHDQKIIFNQEEIELYEKMLNTLGIEYSKREKYETDYTIRDLINECSVRARNCLKAFVYEEDYDKDCLIFISKYKTTSFARYRQVGPAVINEVIGILKSHGFIWEHKPLPSDYKKYLHKV